MQLRKHTDQGFDDYCRERKRVRAKLGPQDSVLGYENQALRELEKVEAREIREQQLTREVHEFFAAATRQAASIVERVSQDAEKQQGVRLQEEVESFLIDALSRMNNFIVSAMQKRRNAGIAETRVEPDIKHLVGDDLDSFRWAGSPETRENHIGKDPFETPLEEVQAEFRAVVADMGHNPHHLTAAPIDDHLVAETASDDVLEEPMAEPEAPAEIADHEAADELVEDDADEAGPSIEEQLESFKGALKALVRQGVMNREEARAAWQTRLASLGRG